MGIWLHIPVCFEQLFDPHFRALSCDFYDVPPLLLARFDTAEAPSLATVWTVGNALLVNPSVGRRHRGKGTMMIVSR